MGLGLSIVYSRTGGLSFLKKAPTADEVARRFHGIASKREPLGPLARLREGQPQVSLLTIEEDVDFRQEGATVVLSGKTSSVGPGYHAYLVELARELADTLGLKITETEEWFDETGYLSSQDFSALQNEMATLFYAMCNFMLDHPDTTIMLSMQTDGHPTGLNAAAATSRGPKELSFFEARQPQRFFSWWEHGVTSNSAAGLIEALLWTEFPWRAPHLVEEKAVVDVVSRLFPIAGDVGNHTKALFNVAVSSETRPPATGIGYRRGDFTRYLPSGWSLVVPGYFLSDFDEGTMSFWYDGRTVYASVFSVTLKEAGRVDPFAKDDLPHFAEMDGVIYRWAVSAFEEDGETGWRIWGGASDSDGFVSCSVVYLDPSDSDWAKSVLLSLKRPVHSESGSGISS